VPVARKATESPSAAAAAPPAAVQAAAARDKRKRVRKTPRPDLPLPASVGEKGRVSIGLVDVFIYFSPSFVFDSWTYRFPCRRKKRRSNTDTYRTRPGCRQEETEWWVVFSLFSLLF